MLKKILKITGIFLLLLVVAAFAAPFIFKGKMVALAKEQINKNLNAKVDFKDIDLSFFRHFPKVAVSVTGLSIAGTDAFAGDTLIAAKNIDISLNLMSVIKGSNFKIYNIQVDEPRIHAIVNKDGRANWSISKPDSSSQAGASSKPFQLNLEAYSITNAYIKYQDIPGNMAAEIINLNHSGSGDFEADLFTLTTKTSADALSFSYGNIPYFSKTKTSVDADIEVDNKANKYSFKTDKIALNDLILHAEGFFQFLNDSVYNMDIRYNAPSTDFKNILSLIPVVYQKDFASIKTSGNAIFNGFVKGKYGNNQVPAYNLNLDVKNGFFQYPDLPRPVKNINFSLKLDNPDGITDHAVVNIPQGHIEIDNEPFDFKLLLKTPISDMYVDAAAKGKLDLSNISSMVKLEKGTKLAGILLANISANGYISALEKKQYEQFNAAGTINLNDFLYASGSYPDGVKLGNLQASFTPKNLSIANLSGQYLKTNFTANGSIDNVLPYMLKNQPLSGVLNIKADQMNLNDWMGTSTDTSTKGADAAPFAVPANLGFIVNATVDGVHYDKVDLKNLSGALSIKDETVFLNNIKANALDGTIAISGSYSTQKSKTKPDISLNYDVKGLDVQKTFNAFNSVQKLMPIGKFIAGKLSSQLSVTGKLGDNMMPDLNSLTGNGSLLLIEGFLSKFAPLEKLASTLNIQELQSITVKDIKNYIEFANGKVLVKPFTVKVKDINMELGGMHGFDQSIDYLINMKVPRALMGEKGNTLVNNLAGQLSSKGIPVNLGEFINLKLNMGGTLTNPILKTDLKQAGGSLAQDLKQQATDFAKAKIDSAKASGKNAVKDTVAVIKKQVLQSAAEELKRQLVGQKDSNNATGTQDSRKKVEESAKGLLDNLNPFKKKKPADTTRH